MLAKVDKWELLENGVKIRKKFIFRDFKEAVGFVNKVADLCGKEGHHADIFVSYREVTLTLFTHKIKGLHENDFILAAKIDETQKNNYLL